MKYFVFLAQNINEKGEPTRKAGSPSIYSLVISLYEGTYTYADLAAAVKPAA